VPRRGPILGIVEVLAASILTTWATMTLFLTIGP
jgi:hypothetical protein